MRRGLLAWSKDEVPESVLDARIARCRAAMRENGLGALVLYTNFPRPAAVSYLTHFVPYWNQGLVVVLPEGVPVLIIGLSKRVAGWIAETGHFGEIITTPRSPQELAKLLAARAEGSRIGVVELDKVPLSLLQAVSQHERGFELVDATAVFAAVRNPADEAEIALTRHAIEIARDAFAAIASDADDGAVVAALEGHARRAGAEEVLIDIATDLDAAPGFRRLDGAVAFGERYAIRLSLAYKGHWIRYGRSFTKGGDSRTDNAEVEAYLDRAVTALRDGTNVAGVLRAGMNGVSVTDAIVEGCRGGAPLARLAAAPAGSIVSIGLTAAVGGRTVLISEPVLLASTPGGSARRLAR